MNVELPPTNILKADVSHLRPSLERVEPLLGAPPTQNHSFLSYKLGRRMVFRSNLEKCLK